MNFFFNVDRWSIEIFSFLAYLESYIDRLDNEGVREHSTEILQSARYLTDYVMSVSGNKSKAESFHDHGKFHRRLHVAADGRCSGPLEVFGRARREGSQSNRP